MEQGITVRQYNKLMSEIAQIKQAINQDALIKDLLDEEEAALFLKRDIRTLKNLVYDKTLRLNEHYTQGVAGKRFYKKTALMGIKKTA